MKTKLDYEIDPGCLAQIAATLMSAHAARVAGPHRGLYREESIDEYLKRAFELVVAAQDFLDSLADSTDSLEQLTPF